MASPTSRSPRYSAPARDMSFLDIDERNTRGMRTRTPSPSSVRCFPDEGPRRSLASSIKPQDSLPSTPSPLSRSNRRVCFEPWVGVKSTISIEEMTDEEIESYWLQQDDYLRIRQRNRTVIRCAETHPRGEPLPSSSSEIYEDCQDDIERRESGDYLCIRGLESGSKSESFRKRSYRRNSIQRVLIEQEFQGLQGLRDERVIAELYIEVTSPCKFRAVHKAMEDRITAEEYCSEN